MFDSCSAGLRTAIVGAGAMGSVFGGAIAEQGGDVLLVDVAQEHVDAITARGLAIEERDGSTRVIAVRATTDPAAEPAADIVAVFVKGYHTSSALDLGAPLIGSDTVVVSLQNGWGNGDVIAERMPPERIVVGISYHSAAVLGPGRVAHTASGPVTVGPFSGDDLGRASMVAGVLRAAGFEVEITAEVREQIWKKLVLNAAALPVAALTALVAGGLAAQPAWDLVGTLASETIAVGRAIGISLDRETELEHIRHVLEAAGDTKASMLQDVEAGKRTEIETINGAVSRLGRAAGVETPLNDAMVCLIRAYEQAHPSR
jgi:2-dehydropantoate 2-reductase